MPTISVSVKIFVSIFCLVEMTIGNTHPKYRPPLECPRIVRWIVNDASTHHLKIHLRWHWESAESPSFSQLSLLIARTLVAKNVVDVQVSGLACLVAYKVISTRLWNHTTLFRLSLLQSLLTINIYWERCLTLYHTPLDPSCQRQLEYPQYNLSW